MASELVFHRRQSSNKTTICTVGREVASAPISAHQWTCCQCKCDCQHMCYYRHMLGPLDSVLQNFPHIMISIQAAANIKPRSFLQAGGTGGETASIFTGQRQRCNGTVDSTPELPSAGRHLSAGQDARAPGSHYNTTPHHDNTQARSMARYLLTSPMRRPYLEIQIYFAWGTTVCVSDVYHVKGLSNGRPEWNMQTQFLAPRPRWAFTSIRAIDFAGHLPATWCDISC